MIHTDEYRDFLKSPAFLEPLGIAPGTGLDFQTLGQGEYNLNYRFSHPGTGRDLVLRINTGSQMHLPDQIAYEFSALEDLAPTGRTPVPLACYPGRHMLVMEFLPGRALAYETDLPIAAGILADIHCAPIPDTSRLIRPAAPARAIYEEVAK